jgi:hypothetical protein
MSIQSHKEYISLKLQNLLNEFASAVLSSYPANIYEFTLHWLESRKRSELSDSELQELEYLRKERKLLENL